MTKTRITRRARRATVAHEFAGTAPLATGDMTWDTWVARNGHAHLHLTAPTPAGDLLTLVLTYRNLDTLGADLPKVLRRFPTSTLANWTVASPASVRIRQFRGWYLSVTRQPSSLLPTLNRKRAHGLTRPAWSRYDAVVIAHTRPEAALAALTPA